MSRPCPCTSKRTFDQCCGPYLEGRRLPETAVLLMRSRFTAYALGRVDYLLQTTAAEKRAGLDREELASYCKAVRCVGLKIVATEAGGAGDEAGVVKFHASLQHNGKRTLHVERSTFVREEGAWRYVDGETN
ncbi:MAG: zinc chelation protein SecC [Acidobacteria bacterium]|nr:zinc chelation protein SecC [Acidobacteriota bacterium]